MLGVKIVAAVDANDDGHAEIFVEIGSSASSQTWTIFTLVGGHLRQVTTDGQPVRIPWAELSPSRQRSSVQESAPAQVGMSSGEMSQVAASREPAKASRVPRQS